MLIQSHPSRSQVLNTPQYFHSLTSQLHHSQVCLNTCGVYKLLACVRESVSSCVGCGGLASAQPHTLLLAHVGAQKEGFQLPFALDVDESSTLA